MKTINDLRTVLLDTIQALRDGNIDIEKARAIGDLSQVVVNTAKVEVDMVKAVGGKSKFFLLDEAISEPEPERELEPRPEKPIKEKQVIQEEVKLFKRPEAKYSNRSALGIASGE